MDDMNISNPARPPSLIPHRACVLHCVHLPECRPVESVATALVFMHKFFMLHSFKQHERLFVGSACLFLAAKVEVRCGFGLAFEYKSQGCALSWCWECAFTFSAGGTVAWAIVPCRLLTTPLVAMLNRVLTE